MSYLANPSRHDARLLIRAARNPYYVYTLYKAPGQPFYVGKGVRNRVFDHERDAVHTTLKSHKLNTIRALNTALVPIIYELEFFADEVASLFRERELILRYGRHDLGTGPLTNMTDGGEGPANFSDETRQKHRDTLAGTVEDGSARSAVNLFFHKLGVKVGSVPIKPLGERRLEPLVPHAYPRRPTPRQAAALVATAIGNRVLLGPGVRLERQFSLEDGPAELENGAGKDMLKSGMIVVAGGSAGKELLEVTPLGYVSALKYVGRDTLIDYGVLMPF